MNNFLDAVWLHVGPGYKLSQLIAHTEGEL